MRSASPTQQRQLLALQTIDASVDALTRRAADPPSVREAEANAEQLRAAARQMTAARERLDALRAGPDGTAVLVTRAEAALADALRRGGELAARRPELLAAVPVAEAALAAELAGLRQARQVAAADIEPALLADYEAARDRLGGVAIATVGTGGVCTGCRLVIPSLELDAARRAAATSFPRCPECDRHLVLGTADG